MSKKAYIFYDGYAPESRDIETILIIDEKDDAEYNQIWNEILDCQIFIGKIQRIMRISDAPIALNPFDVLLRELKCRSVEFEIIEDVEEELRMD